MSSECYTYIRKPRVYEASNEITLKKWIESNNLDDCQRGLEELLQSLLAGEKFPTNLMMPVINRYQIMNRFSGCVGNQDKRIKRLLYILWECLPKRGPDGKFLDRMVMVCGAFDKDLKHANQYVCGPVARTLSKTTEPNVLLELVHSIEKCLEYSHPYQRKNAVLAIANLYKELPDLIPSAPKLISEYLMRESDEECKRAALQGLLEISPEEARLYLHSSNVQDIHSMKASMQLLFVKLIQRLYIKGNEEAEDYLSILTALVKLSTSPVVRCQAATTLMRFTRDPETIKQVAACFIDICAKGSDNNVKLDALENLTKLRKINGAERVIRNSVMDIVFILQSASDVTLQSKILRLTLDLLSPLNVGGVVAALRQEIEKTADDSEKASYRRFLVGATYNIAERFPNAIVEYEMIDTLFNLLMNNPGDKISSDLILLFKMFITKNPSNQSKVIEKIQTSFNMIRNSPAIHRGLIQLLGEFSETKGQIEKSYLIIKESLGELPIVASELRKRAPENDENSTGEETGNSNSTISTNKSTTANGDVDTITKGVRRLVTADGSYATQSAISYQSTKADEEHPPLRHYYLHNNFNTASVLCYALLKMACRYQQNITEERNEFDKLIAQFMFLIASILNLGHSILTDPEGRRIRINNDHSENLMLALSILQHLASERHNDSDGKIAQIMKRIMTEDIRSQLKVAVKKVDEEGGFAGDAFKKKAKITSFDDAIPISFFVSRDEDVDLDYDNDEEENSDSAMPDMLGEIPLTGTIDAIYACCEFDANQYDVELRIHLENRTQATLENVTLELAPRGENSSNIVDRPDPILLARDANACIISNIKVLSAENRKLFGSISYENTSKANPEDREQVLMLNDINVNITDYIKPAKISFDEFLEVWRDCEWENKVTVKTKLTNLKDYLLQLVTATNMRCVTSEKSLDGDCSFLSANLYARSSFGEEALVNVSIEKVSPSSNVIGSVKIRSRSQGMALSLGEKITTAQSASAQDDLPKKDM